LSTGGLKGFCFYPYFGLLAADMHGPRHRLFLLALEATPRYADSSGANPSSSCSPARNCSVLYEESAQFPEYPDLESLGTYGALTVMGHCSELPATWEHPLQDAVTVDENMGQRRGDMNADCD
jgi:hypothetical protein